MLAIQQTFPIGRREPVGKMFRHGTERTTDPDTTLRRIEPALTHFGITRVANVTGLDSIGVPVTMVCRPNSRSVSVSQGKGLTLAAAKVSGIMEAIELWHAERISGPLQYASAAEMEAVGQTVDLSRLPLRIRSRYRRDLRLLWIAGHDLVAGVTKWVPYECVSMDSTLPQPAGSGCFLGTSNGLASGNDILEAVSHAVCEAIERDATALWRSGGQSETADELIDLASVTDPACLEILDRCRRAGVDALAWNITSDVTVPSIAALITERDAAHPIRATAMGYGCHPQPGVALLRALTEAVQSRLTYISGSRDDLFRGEYEDNVRTRVSIERFHQLIDVPHRRNFSTIESQATDTFDADVAKQIQLLRAVGIEEVVVVDLSHSTFGMSVVRVVIPGLEGPESDPDYVKGTRAVTRVERR